MNDLSRLSLASNPQATSTRLRLLVLSNGHGEDVIAVRILQELQKQPNPPEIFALPLVGEGHAYKKLDIPLIGSVRTMPSGGFVYMDGKQLVRDVRGGLVQLTLNQIKASRHWVKQEKNAGHKAAVLAVGDIVPLLFAWYSGVNYGFVGTAKSEYYVRDEAGLLKRTNKGAWAENFSGSIYHPWERWLMSRRHCKAVFPRDSLTTEILKKWRSIPAFDVGNPMMDGLEPSFPTARFWSVEQNYQEMERPLVITLLPGSRPPEAYANWESIAIAISALMATFRTRDAFAHTSGAVVFLAAIAPGLELEKFMRTIQVQGWREDSNSECPLKLPDPKALTFQNKNAYLIFSQNAYNDCLHLGDFAIAMAGTATEQFIGLGKPAIAIPGKGPQYNPGFAEAQSRHLGESLILAKQPVEVAAEAQALMANPDRLHAIRNNGLRRMGQPGAAQRIAEHVMDRLG